MKPRSVIEGLIGALLVAGCASIGYVLGRQHASDPEQAIAEAVEASVSMLRDVADDATGEPDKIAPTSAEAIIARIYEVRAIQDYNERRYNNEVIFDNMTADQARDVFAALMTLPPSKKTHQMLIFFFVRWGKVDGTAAVRAATQLDGRQRAMLTAMALSGWGQSDPNAAWDVARGIAKGWPEVTARIGSVITNLAKQDLDAAIAARHNDTGPSGSNVAQQSVITYAAEEGQFDAVFDNVLAFNSVEEQKSWLNALFSRWASHDEAAPLAALESITDPVLVESAMDGFLRGWTSADPEGALDYLLGHQDEPAVKRALPEALAQAFNHADRRTTLGLVERISAVDDVDTMAPSVLPFLASASPEAAFGVAEKLSDEEQRKRYTAMAVGRWAQEDFEAATARFERLPDSEAKLQAVQSMAFSAMMREDGGERIARWVNAMPAGRERTGTLEQLLGLAESRGRTLSNGSKQALQELVAQAPDLSEQAQAHAQRLFGDAAAPTGQP